MKDRVIKEVEPTYKKQLGNHARRVAKEAVKLINKTVPESVEGMLYARQYVLEEAIKILQESV